MDQRRVYGYWIEVRHSQIEYYLRGRSQVVLLVEQLGYPCDCPLIQSFWVSAGCWISLEGQRSQDDRPAQGSYYSWLAHCFDSVWHGHQPIGIFCRRAVRGQLSWLLVFLFIKTVCVRLMMTNTSYLSMHLLFAHTVVGYPHLLARSVESLPLKSLLDLRHMLLLPTLFWARRQVAFRQQL